MDVHSHSDFGGNFRCHLRSSQPLARGSCKCPLHCHVILLPEAPGQPGVTKVAVQNGVQPAVYLRNAAEQSCLFSCIVLLQGEVQLSHGKAPLLEIWVILSSHTAKCSALSFKSFSVRTFILSQVLICLCAGSAGSMKFCQSSSMGSAKAATWAALPLSFGPPFFL